MVEYIILLSCVFILALVLFLLHRHKKHSTVPGPAVIDRKQGHLADIKASGSLHEFLLQLHGRYGAIARFYLGPTFCVSIASPELFKQHAKVFDRPKELFAIFEPLLTPHSIQYANGSNGRMRHTAYSRSFTHERIVHYMETFCTLSKDVCTEWEGKTPEEHIGTSESMNTYACKVILAVGFGQYFDSNRALEFKKCYDYVWLEMERSLKGEPPDAERLDIFNKYKEKMQEMLRVAYTQAKNNQLPETDHKRFIDELIELDLDDEVTAADMMTVCIGGFHTTGTLLTWVVYFLASYEDIQERVYQEMRDVLGHETITFEAANQLTYTRQVLDETLRCSTLGPFAARVENADSVLGGYKIPAGTPVVHALGVVQFDERLWPEPEKFDPERFNEDNRKKLLNYAFEPFGFAGKRKCLGYRMSYFESTVLLSEIIRKFKIKLVEGQVVQKDTGLVCKPADEIWITIDRRN